MTRKRARLIGAACIVAIIVMLVLAKCMPTEVSADPVMVGPPTIYEHVAGINASMQFFKYVAGILATMFTFILGLLGYIWRITIANIKSSIGHVERKAEKAFDKAEEIDTKMDTEKDRVNRDFRSVQTCNERHHNGHQ